MKVFPKDEQAKQICREWADDFKQKGMLRDFMFWQGAALGFDTGGSVANDSIIVEMNHAIRTKIEASKMAAMLPAQIRKAIAQIGGEAEYLQTVMAKVD